MYSLTLRVACFAAVACPFAWGLYTYRPEPLSCQPVSYRVTSCNGVWTDGFGKTRFRDLRPNYEHPVRERSAEEQRWANLYGDKAATDFLSCDTSYWCNSIECLQNFNHGQLGAIANGLWRRSHESGKVQQVFCTSTSPPRFTCEEPQALPIEWNESRANSMCTSADLPPVLLGYCLGGHFDILQYAACQHSGRWAPACLAPPIACQRAIQDPIYQAASSAFPLFVSIPPASLLLLIVLLLLQDCFKGKRSLCLPGTIRTDPDLRTKVQQRTELVKGRMELRLLERSRKDRVKQDFEFVLFFIDLLSDLTCIVQFSLNGYPEFALAQTVIVVLSLVSELVRGSPCTLFEAVLDSHRLGYPTDAYSSIVRSEKTIEAPLSLLLQYYSAFYLNGTPLTFLSTCASMTLSVWGVTKGAYEQLHLALAEVQDKAELALAHSSDSTTRTGCWGVFSDALD